MSRPKDPKRRRTLLNAGKEVINDKGTEKMTIDEVTAKAGVAKGTFYLYFKSKDELIAALRQDFMQQVSAAPGDETESAGQRNTAGSLQKQQELESKQDWRETAHALVRDAVERYLRLAPDYAPILGCSPADQDDQWEQNITETIAAFLAHANGDAQIGSHTSQALFIFHGINGLCHHAIQQGSQSVELISTTIDTFIDAIIPEHYEV